MEMKEMVGFVETHNKNLNKVVTHADAILRKMKEHNIFKGSIDVDSICYFYLHNTSERKIYFVEVGEQIDYYENQSMPYEIFKIEDVDLACDAWIKKLTDAKLNEMNLSPDEEISIAKRILDKHGIEFVK